ncbi:hypothetical protein Vretimale_2261, partial [Volvox reticuliferus]
FDLSGIAAVRERLQQDGRAPVISYGPCQFPTLGIIVQRAWEVQNHVREQFWTIHVAYREPPAAGGGQCVFEWLRGRLFDEAAAEMYFEICQEAGPAVVVAVRGSTRTRQAPAPLSTLEMQKRATAKLRMSGERIMKLAEELYQAGFISYPRTETDVFDPGMDLRGIVSEHAEDPRWGAHAQRILSGELWRQPRPGGHDDKAHPPIHPTRHSLGEHDWGNDKRQLYEFIVRHFLACCSKDAIGSETQVEIDIGGERFRTTGLMVIERNWLDVYPYSGWGGNDNLPKLTQGQSFSPTELRLRTGTTEPPPRLSERDLIAKMEAYGIGTDATVAEHIQKQLERGYAEKDEAALTFWPTPLGEALISGYCRMGLDDLWKPDLRGKIEASIRDVAAGRISKEQVLQQAIQFFRADFLTAQQRAGVLASEMARFLPMAGAGGAGGGGGGSG